MLKRKRYLSPFHLLAKSLTCGAQTGRGSDNSCVVNRTHEQKHARLTEVVHQLAQSAEGAALLHLKFQIVKLEQGQALSQHRDYRNHADHPNDTMKSGSYKGGSLQMLRQEVGHSYDKDNVWMSFDALKVTHRVTEVTAGHHYSITLFYSR